MTEQRAVDASVIAVLDQSLSVRALTASVAWLAAAWHGSASKRVASIAVDRGRSLSVASRIRLAVLLLMTTVVVHIAVTGFAAPAPTAAVRVVWVAILCVLAATWAGARHIANGWRDRTAIQARRGCDS
jgi:hypothetical protein